MTPEAKVKAAIRQILKRYGVWYFSPVSNGMGVHGIPDFVCVYHGKSLMIEAKAPGKKPTLRQELQIAAIRSAGGTVFVIDGDYSELIEWLEKNACATG